MKTSERLAALLLVLVLYSCTETPISAVPDSDTSARLAKTPVVCPALPTGTTSILIVPNAATIGVGATGDLQVTNQAGVTVNDCNVKWTSSDSRLANVNATGLVTGLKSGGPIMIRASTSTRPSLVGSAALTVSAVRVTSVTVPAANVPVNATLVLTATMKGSDGSTLTNRFVRWSSAQASVARVDSVTGAVTGVSNGEVTITGTSEGVRGSATITVGPAPVQTVTVTPATGSLYIGQTLPLSATATDVAGNVLTGRSVTWTSSSSAVATISNQGIVTAVAPGTATLTATVEGKTGTAIVTTSLVPVQTVTVTPAVQNLYLGQTVQLSAVVKDGAGNVLTDRPVTWTSASPASVTISSTGLVTAIAPASSVRMTATAGGVSGTSTIAVLATEIVYQRDGGNWVNNSTEELWIVNPDGSGDTRLTNNANIDQRPVLSPDGTRIAFSSDVGKSPYFDGIWVMNRDGSNRVALTPEYAGSSTGPAWSPDGKKIAFYSTRNIIGGEIGWLVVMNADGTEKFVIDSNSTAYSRFNPAWSRDGTKLYHGANNGRWPFQAQIWTVNADGSNARPLFTSGNSEWVEAGAVSPDGTKLVFTSDRDGNREIYVMNIDGTGQTRLTNQAGDDQMPCWSPDGTKIVFSSGRTGTAQIWIMNADGSNPERLNTGTDWAYYPFWR